jgi:hypothetical protein
MAALVFLLPFFMWDMRKGKKARTLNDETTLNDENVLTDHLQHGKPSVPLYLG